MCNSLIYLSICFLAPQHALQIIIHLAGDWGVETKCWVPPLQLHRPPLPRGRPSRISFLTSWWYMGFCSNEQQNNCTGYFSFLALRKNHVPSWRTDLFFIFFLILFAQMWFKVWDRSAGGRSPPRVLLLPQSQCWAWTSWSLAIPCGHRMNGLGKGRPRSPIPLSCNVRMGLPEPSFHGNRLCWAGQFTVTDCSVVTVECSWGGNSIWVTLNCKKLHHVTVLYVTLHTENVPQRQAKLFTLISNVTQKPR